jgi:hypothetical protein
LDAPGADLMSAAVAAISGLVVVFVISRLSDRPLDGSDTL